MYRDISLINVELNGGVALAHRCLPNPYLSPIQPKNKHDFVLAGQCMEENRGFVTRSTYLMIVSLAAVVAIYR